MELQINHVKKFFDLVDQGEYTNIEVYNYVDRLTDNFKVEKLKVFLADINETLSDRREEYLAEYLTLLPSTLRSYKALGRAIPFQIVNGKQVPDAGKIYGQAISSNLYCLYELKFLVEAKIEGKSIEYSPHLTKLEVNEPSFSVGLEHFLIKEGQPYFEGIKKHYQNVKFNTYVYMIFALWELKLLTHNPINNQSLIHQALQTTFGKVGGIKNFNTYISKLSRSTEEEETEIKRHIRLIETLHSKG